MPQVLKRRRVVNPGRARVRRASGIRRSRKRMTAKQIKYFGTKRQKAALKSHRRRNPIPRKSRATKRVYETLASTWKRAKREIGRGPYKKRRARKRESNIGEILTILPGNPGRKKRSVTSMARRKRRIGVVRHRRVTRRRKQNAGTRIGRSWSTYTHRRKRRNPGKVVVYRYRGRKSVRRHSGRRRNPGMFGGTFGKVLGVIAGATVTKLVTDRLPTSLNGGFIGYLSTGVVAMLQGKLIGKVTKNSTLAQDMTIGGFTYLALRVVSDYLPGLYSNIGLRGMGILTPSSFFVPQVNQPGSMANFIAPAGLPVATAAGGAMRGLGSARRVGRVA